MTIQYPSRSLAQEAAQIAVCQQLAADQSTRLDSPFEAEPAIPTLLEPSPAPGCEHLRHLLIGSPTGVQEAIARLHLLDYGDIVKCGVREEIKRRPDERCSLGADW